VAHLALEEDRAELALSVLPAHRGNGMGSTLFRHAADLARDRCLRSLVMYFLSCNVAVIRIAERFGMNIRERGGDVAAYLKLDLAQFPMRRIEVV
jgi:GNAT superfamily N-acetyltransferase